MVSTSVNMPSELREDVDEQRHSTTSRSEWVVEAIQVRLALEDQGEFADILDDLTADCEQVEHAAE